MIFFVKRAFQDIRSNWFLHVITVITITLSILIVSTFCLFFINAGEVMDSWKNKIKIMAYLEGQTDSGQISQIKQQISKFDNVIKVVFIPKDKALAQLKSQMARQSSIFDNLPENPLPDAFEIQVQSTGQNWGVVEQLAERINQIPQVKDVEYGQKWLENFTTVFNLFKYAGYIVCAVFFMASVFIVANTIRLLYYSRNEEFEIMRLVGATDGFIKAPFYLEGLFQGLCGSIIGMAFLFIIFVLITSNMNKNFSHDFITLRFLTSEYIFIIMGFSMFAGWLGCYLSLKQFLTKK